MPSEFNHIDEFFRRKEDESLAPGQMLDQQWDLMKKELQQSAKPTKKIRTFPWRLYWQAAAILIVVAATAFLFLRQTPSKTTTAGTNTRVTKPIETQPLPTPVTNTNLVQSAKRHQFTPVTLSKAPLTPQNNWKEQSTSLSSKFDSLLNLANKNEANENEGSSKLQAFFQELKKPAQEFSVNAKQDTSIICAEGTVLEVPANSFQATNGKTVEGQVTIAVQEFYDLSDIIGNKLTTTSDGDALVTGGMLHISAYAGNEELELKPGAALQLKMPTNRFDPQMQLFMGNGPSQPPIDDATTADFVNWKPMGQTQAFYNNVKKQVPILNLTNNPWKVHYKHEFNPSKSVSVASFIIPWYVDMPVDQVKELLTKKYGKYYDEIKVKREWKPLFPKKKKPSGTTAQWFETAFVADSVDMHISFATRKGYITKADSLHYEEIWKEEILARTRALNNMSYSMFREQDATTSSFFALGKEYSFSITNLGWINCDHFMGLPKSRLTNFAVKLQSGFNDHAVHAVLVFKNENAIMPGILHNNKIHFDHIPKGEDVSIICITVKNGKTYACIQDLTVDNWKQDELKLTEVNPQQLKEKLKHLGNVITRG